jgi:hypothetical protein
MDVDVVPANESAGNTHTSDAAHQNVDNAENADYFHKSKDAHDAMQGETITERTMPPFHDEYDDDYGHDDDGGGDDDADEEDDEDDDYVPQVMDARELATSPYTHHHHHHQPVDATTKSLQSMYGDVLSLIII